MNLVTAENYRRHAVGVSHITVAPVGSAAEPTATPPRDGIAARSATAAPARPATITPTASQGWPTSLPSPRRSPARTARIVSGPDASADCVSPVGSDSPESDGGPGASASCAAGSPTAPQPEPQSTARQVSARSLPSRSGGPAGAGPACVAPGPCSGALRVTARSLLSRSRGPAGAGPVCGVCGALGRGLVWRAAVGLPWIARAVDPSAATSVACSARWCTSM